MKRSAIYLRISSDQIAGQGVKDQEPRCRALALAHDAEVTVVLTDNDISASSYSKKARPAYQKLLELIRTRQIDIVIADDQDRLIRRPQELEEFMDVVGIDKAKVQVLTCRAGEHDFATSSGRLNARIKGAVSAHESEIKSERIKDKIQAHVIQGIRQGGPRPYGWHRAPKTGPAPCPSCGDMMELESYGARMRAKVEQCPVETVRIMIFAQMKLGTSEAPALPLWQLAKMANEQGWPTASGLVGQWRAQTIANMLKSPGIRGERANSNGSANSVAWEPILPADEHEQVMSAMRTRYSKNIVPTSLLGGLKLLRCGRCRHTLHVASPSGKSSGPAGASTNKRYACPPTANGASSGGPCGGSSAVQHAVDKQVVTLLLEDIRRYIQDPDRGTSQAQQQKVLEMQAEDVKLAMKRLTGDYYGPDSRLSQDLFHMQYDKLNISLQEIKHRMDSIVVYEDVTSVIPEKVEDVESWWSELEIDRKRETLLTLVEEILLQPVGSDSGSKFKPERITLTMKPGARARRNAEAYQESA